MQHCMLLEALWQYCHAWITYRSACRVILAMTDHVTCGTIYLSCETRAHLTNDECMSDQNTCHEHTSSSNPHMIHSNDQSGKCASNVTTRDNETNYQTLQNTHRQ